jgi:integrase/recombinase XerD
VPGHPAELFVGELRHTCLTRLREAGMALEAVQAQAGHASIETGPDLPAPG